MLRSQGRMRSWNNCFSPARMRRMQSASNSGLEAVMVLGSLAWRDWDRLDRRSIWTVSEELYRAARRQRRKPNASSGGG